MMIPDGDRWEQGSDLHWGIFAPVAQQTKQPWDSGGTLWGSGRDAMRKLLEWGRQQDGWWRLWCPSFFCQEVVEALRTCGLEILAYPDSPKEAFDPSALVDLDEGDAVLVVNFFGLRQRPSYDSVSSGVAIIEDHSHDPWSHWSRSSIADWCVASLRKTLPIPDGGALWSPRGLLGPSQRGVSAERARVAYQKFSAMVLKGMYLEGHAIEKAVFRELLMAAEENIASGDVSGISPLSRQLLSALPVEDWRAARRRNYRVLETAVGAVPQIEILPVGSDHDAPFSVPLIFASRGERDRVRQRLIDERVYPAILWSLDEIRMGGIPAEHLELAGRTFSIHCDMRYDASDMKHVGGLICEAFS